MIACTKPPLALILLFYYLLKKNQKALTVSVPVILAISAISLFRLRSISWWPVYMKSIHDYSASGGTLGVTDHGVLNFGFSNLQALFYVLFRSPHYAVIGNYLTLILLVILFTWTGAEVAWFRDAIERQYLSAIDCWLSHVVPGIAAVL